MTEFRYPDDCQSNEDIADFWAIRLDQGDLDRCEQMAFENWQAENSGNVRLLMRARQTWRSMEIAVTDSPRPAQENTERQPVDLDGIRADLERLGALEGGQGRLPGMRSGTDRGQRCQCGPRNSRTDRWFTGLDGTGNTACGQI